MCSLLAVALAMVLGRTAGANEHLVPSQVIPIPGRGLVLAWAPDGSTIAVAGHLIDKTRRNLRYDAKLYDAHTGAYVKAFGSHYWWVLALDWSLNPWLGEVIADAGDDHAAKLWDPAGAGTVRTVRGQYRVEDGALPAVRAISSAGLVGINGAMLALDFSPDGRWLAGANRDRTVRIWQIEPGPQQFRIVKIFYDAAGGNITSVRLSLIHI